MSKGKLSFRVGSILHMILHISLGLALFICWRLHGESQRAFEETTKLERKKAVENIMLARRGAWVAGRANQTLTWLRIHNNEGSSFADASQEEALMMIALLFNDRDLVDFPKDQLGSASLSLASLILSELTITTYDQFVLKAERIEPIEEFGYILYAEDQDEYAEQFRAFIEKACQLKVE